MALGSHATTPMTDDALRIFVYDHVIGRGVVPRSPDIAEHFGLDVDDARDRLASLKLGKTVVVRRSTGEIWMAGPFAGGPTQYRLSDGSTTWYANCGWAMLGVAMLVRRPLLAEAPCVDCGERITVECDPDRPPSGTDTVVHFPWPARRWYNDIGITCSSMTIFRSEDHAERWIRANRAPVGEIVPLETVWALAKAWYTDPRSPDWRPRTRWDSQAALASVGLTGEYWSLPG